MDWYVTSLLLCHAGGRENQDVRRCHYLIAATNHDEAYGRSLEIGESLEAGSLAMPGPETGPWLFKGLYDLLMVHDPPTDGAELVWSELEVAPRELENIVRPKEMLRAFREAPSTIRPSGWYIVSLVIYEVHDRGSHGDTYLVWINTYLIRANEAEPAYQRALQLGQMQQTAPGSHRCDGDNAHWEFKGIDDIVQACDPPRDQALLWIDQLMVTTAELERMAADKANLGVFKWEALQRIRKL